VIVKASICFFIPQHGHFHPLNKYSETQPENLQTKLESTETVLDLDNEIGVCVPGAPRFDTYTRLLTLDDTSTLFNLVSH